MGAQSRGPVRRYLPGELVIFRRGRVAHIVGRPRSDAVPRTVCGAPVSLEDRAGNMPLTAVRDSTAVIDSAISTLESRIAGWQERCGKETLAEFRI